MAYPSFNFEQIERLCQDLKHQLIGSQVLNCSPNNLKRFFITFQSGQRLFFSFEHPYIRFNLSTQPTPTDSHHPIHTYLKGTILKSIEILNNDRIVQFTFDQTHLICEFFSKHPNYYLTDSSGQIFFSLFPHQTTTYQPPIQKNRQPHSGSPLSHQQIEQLYLKLEQELSFERQKLHIQTQLTKTLKKLDFRKKQLLQALKDCENWEEVQHEGDLLKANLGLIHKGINSITVFDWKTEKEKVISIDPKSTPKDEMAAKFHRAKKLQKGFIPLQKQLDKALEDSIKIEAKLRTLEAAKNCEDLGVFQLFLPKPPKSKTTLTPALPYHEFVSASGFKIWVGKSARANDKLTFQLANGNDWWLHVSGYAGSHIVIKTGKEMEPDQETLHDAIQLAIFYSKAKDRGEAEVCVTQKKYVTRMARDKPGKVQVSKHKTRWAKLDKSRLEALKSR